MMRTSKSSPRLSLAACLALSLLCLAGSAHAQDGSAGRLEGRVIDSTRARPLAGARVVAVGMDARASTSGAASTDSAGRYHIDSLPPGRYFVGFESPLLDSLEVTVSPREATVTSTGAAKVDLALPPAAKLRAAVCPGLSLPPETGAIVGYVLSAETESPLAGVTIAMAWSELGFDRAKVRPIKQERTVSVVTDEGGWYRLCGVPTGTWLSMQLQHGGRSGPVLRTHLGDTLGLTVRYLSFSASTARAAADTTSAGRDRADAAPLSGTARLSGFVLGPDGAPLAQADVRVRGTVASTRTDAQGSYTLAALPAGTQMLVVRHVGYAIAETSVELREGKTTTSTIRLERIIVNLDSVRVVATRTRYPEFAVHQKFNILGRMLGPEELARLHVTSTSQIVARIPSFRISGEGPQAKVLDARGQVSLSRCAANIVVDGAEGFEINDVAPNEIGAMEVYPAGPPLYPLEYRAGCGGLIIIWTKR
jgi:hypothetical protein